MSELDLKAGPTLLLLETPEGIVVATRDQAKRADRRQLQGSGRVVDELVSRSVASPLDAERHE